MKTFKTLVNEAYFGTIKGEAVILMVDVEASLDRTFKLRFVDPNNGKGWDYGASHSDCYAVINDLKTFEEAFDGFVK